MFTIHHRNDWGGVMFSITLAIEDDGLEEVQGHLQGLHSYFERHVKELLETLKQFYPYVEEYDTKISLQDGAAQVYRMCNCHGSTPSSTIQEIAKKLDIEFVEDNQ